MTFQEFAKEAFCCTPVAPRLDEDINHVPILIDRPPQILPLTVDGDKDFVQKPSVSELTLSPLQALGIVAPELQAPPADCLVGYGDSSFGEQILCNDNIFRFRRTFRYVQYLTGCNQC